MKKSHKTKLMGLAVLLLIPVLILSLSNCGRKEDPVDETIAGTVAESVTEYVPEPQIEPTTEITIETQPPCVVVTMGTITASELNIRKNAGSHHESIGVYRKGDRVEILDTLSVDETVWGRTGKGWISMGYVQMDGTRKPAGEGTENAVESKLITDGNTQVLSYGVVDLGALNVRMGPGTDYLLVKEITEGTRYAIYQMSGSWVRIEDGWVSTEYFYVEGTTAEDAASGVILTDGLNYRNGPHTDFKSNGTYQAGEVVVIHAQVAGWGYTHKGWVSLKHVELSAPSYSPGTGTVLSGLNIRQEPNADSEILGTYKEGDRIRIIEVRDSWGRTPQGWINLKYVKFD